MSLVNNQLTRAGAMALSLVAGQAALNPHARGQETVVQPREQPRLAPPAQEAPALLAPSEPALTIPGSGVPTLNSAPTPLPSDADQNRNLGGGLSQPGNFDGRPYERVGAGVDRSRVQERPFTENDILFSEQLKNVERVLGISYVPSKTPLADLDTRFHTAVENIFKQCFGITLDENTSAHYRQNPAEAMQELHRQLGLPWANGFPIFGLSVPQTDKDYWTRKNLTIALKRALPFVISNLEMKVAPKPPVETKPGSPMPQPLYPVQEGLPPAPTSASKGSRRELDAGAAWEREVAGNFVRPTRIPSLSELASAPESRLVAGKFERGLPGKVPMAVRTRVENPPATQQQQQRPKSNGTSPVTPKTQPRREAIAKISRSSTLISD